MKTEINEKLELDFFNLQNDVVVLNIMNFATGIALPVFLSKQDAIKMANAILEKTV